MPRLCWRLMEADGWRVVQKWVSSARARQHKNASSQLKSERGQSPWLDIPAEVLPVGCSVTSNSAGSWTVAHQALLSISRQEYGSRLPFPPPAGIKPAALSSPALEGGFFTPSVTWEALPRTALNAILRSLELYSGAAYKPLTGFQGRGIRNEKDIIDTRNICLLNIFVTRNKTFS